jgi:hypothetical protein
MAKSPASLRCAAIAAVAALGAPWPAHADSEAVRVPTVLPLTQQQGDASLDLIGARPAGKTARQNRMRRCLASWDPATQMSKREWRAACRRVIIQQPYMFGPDPL